MAIILRNGVAADFDANKMRTAEAAVVTDKREFHVTFAPGDSPKALFEGDAVENPGTAGTEGQVLKMGENGPEWDNVASPTDAQVAESVSAWLDEHPEATTTVEDGSITKSKLDSVLSAKVDEVDSLQSDLSALGLSVVDGAINITFQEAV